jgi:G3E family GTPase
MIGGFLGAGKTTALLRLAEYLTGQGRRVGLITNDQSSGLVDTALVDSHGYPVQEITGGCFCCRFNSLTAAAERLTEEAKPDVFLAEPVGSCTDLRASVQYPLRRLYGDGYRIAPLSVLVDPVRALRILQVEPGKVFSPKVLYVYGKQLEEADIIVINKSDIVEPQRLARLAEALATTYPNAQIFSVSARTGQGLEDWFGRILQTESDSRVAPAVDYDIYAEGEALLGWLNATIRVAGPAFDGNALLREMARMLRLNLNSRGQEIAHLKMVLTPDEDSGDIAALNLVAGDREAELSHALQDVLTSGELILNLRAEGDPQVLSSVVLDLLNDLDLQYCIIPTVEHMEHFRPARPVPTYRMATEGIA